MPQRVGSLVFIIHFFIQLREDKTLWKEINLRVIFIVLWRSERKRLITTCCGLILHTCREAKRDGKYSIVHKGNILSQRITMNNRDYIRKWAHAPMPFPFNTMTLLTFLSGSPHCIVICCHMSHGLVCRDGT